MPKEKSDNGVLWFLGFMVVLVILAHYVSQNSGTGAGTSTGGEKTVRATCWCAESFEDAGQVWLAVGRGDTPAVYGLLARGKAYEVAEGTRVLDTGVSDYGITGTIVKSGFHAGRKCYIAANALR